MFINRGCAHGPVGMKWKQNRINYNNKKIN